MTKTEAVTNLTGSGMSEYAALVTLRKAYEYGQSDTADYSVFYSEDQGFMIVVRKTQPWTAGLSSDELTELAAELEKAYKVVSRLETYEHEKYPQSTSIDYSFGTELVELMGDCLYTS